MGQNFSIQQCRCSGEVDVDTWSFSDEYEQMTQRKADWLFEGRIRRSWNVSGASSTDTFPELGVTFSEPFTGLPDQKILPNLAQSFTNLVQIIDYHCLIITKPLRRPLHLVLCCLVFIGLPSLRNIFGSCRRLLLQLHLASKEKEQSHGLIDIINYQQLRLLRILCLGQLPNIQKNRQTTAKTTAKTPKKTQRDYTPSLLKD